MRRISLLLALVASLFVTPALADFTGKDGSLATITFKNPGTCTAVVCVPVFQLYDGTNVVALTTAGADGVSNTLTGLPTYDRMLIYNGTTWDRWQGAIKAGANAFAAGSLAIGAGVDGWSITDGVTTDAASTAGGTGTHSAKLRLMTTQLNTVAINQSSQITQETATAAGVGAPADAAWVSGSGSTIAILKNIATGVATNTGATSSTLTGWTSATALNATQIISGSGGAPAILVQLNQTSTLTAGAITFEGTYDGTNWVSIPVAQVLNPNTFANLTNPYTLVASTNQPFLLLPQGYQSVRIKLSTQITGTATVTPQVTLLPYNPTIGAILNPISAGSAIIGKVGIDQTTDGTTNGVRLTNGYPAGATPLTASATGTTAATTATLAGALGKTTYICSLSVRANATANTNVTDTVTGVITGTLSRALWVPANTAGLGVDEQIYNPCVPASTTNTAIAVVSGAPGTGGVVTVNATGYQQ